MSSYASNAQVGSFSTQTRVKEIARNMMKNTLVFLIRAITPKEAVFLAVELAVERHDAEITARDNELNEIAKRRALAFQADV